MTKRVVHVKNAQGQNFLAVKMDSLELHGQITEMRSIVGKEKFEVLLENRIVEQGDTHYVTVVDATEYMALTQQIGVGRFVEALQPVLDFDIDDIRLGGVSVDEYEVCSVVCESDKLGAVRTRFGLPAVEFRAHIGIGSATFKKRDC